MHRVSMGFSRQTVIEHKLHFEHVHIKLFDNYFKNDTKYKYVNSLIKQCIGDYCFFINIMWCILITAIYTV